MTSLQLTVLQAAHTAIAEGTQPDPLMAGILAACIEELSSLGPPTSVGAIPEQTDALSAEPKENGASIAPEAGPQTPPDRTSEPGPLSLLHLTAPIADEEFPEGYPWPPPAETRLVGLGNPPSPQTTNHTSQSTSPDPVPPSAAASPPTGQSSGQDRETDAQGPVEPLDKAPGSNDEEESSGAVVEAPAEPEEDEVGQVRRQILGLDTDGIPAREIAKRLELPLNTINSVLQEAKGLAAFTPGQTIPIDSEEINANQRKAIECCIGVPTVPEELSPAQFADYVALLADGIGSAEARAKLGLDLGMATGRITAHANRLAAKCVQFARPAARRHYLATLRAVIGATTQTEAAA